MKLLYVFALTTLLMLPGTAIAQHARRARPRVKTAATTQPHWQLSDFCPDKTRCDKAALFYDPQHGTILVLWKGAQVTVSAISGDFEHRATRAEGKDTEVFRKMVDKVCADCGHFKDGSAVVLHEWVDTDAAGGKALLHEVWAQEALRALPWQDDNVAAITGGQKQ
jgi:hypothetical protein